MHPDSKVYLIYGCNQPVTYETYVKFRILKNCYLLPRWIKKRLGKWILGIMRIYKWDYFLDDRNVETEIDSFVFDEEAEEFEWTLLELELANMVSGGETISAIGENSFSESTSVNDNESELIGLNPEEMLSYVCKNSCDN